jgi:hypothetical protein
MTMTKVGVAGFLLALTMESGTSAGYKCALATTNLDETARTQKLCSIY